jgi:hypothetical protein
VIKVALNVSEEKRRLVLSLLAVLEQRVVFISSDSLGSSCVAYLSLLMSAAHP